MSRLTETQRAYSTLVQLLDREIRKRPGPTRDLERFRESLDVAFYLLGWSQFEYLVRQEAEDLIDAKTRSKSAERHAWRYLQDNLKALAVRRSLNLIFHTKSAVLNWTKITNSATRPYTIIGTFRKKPKTFQLGS